MKPVVVTGATGKTGAEVVAHLLRHEVTTIALVHRDDARAERLRPLGATVAVGDFGDTASLRSVLRGAQGAYLCLPPEPDLLEWTASFIEAARAERISRVVNMSQLHVREGHPSPLTRQHWLAERMLDLAGVGAVHLRSSFFAEGYLILGAAAVAGASPLALPFGAERLAPVACADIGRVAAAILSSPDRDWDGAYTVTGPALLNHAEIAAALSAAAGRRIEYVDAPIAMWRAGAAQAGLPPFLIEHFARTAEDVKRGVFAELTGVVPGIGGAPATPFAEVVERALSGAAASAARA
jgi:NAD(P)H dehydrogenase (quinone)